MTDKELRQLRWLPGEIKRLKQEISDAKNKLHSLREHSVVQASLDEEPYTKHTVTISAPGRTPDAFAAQQRLQKARSELAKCTAEWERLNAFIDGIRDTQTRRIFEMHYREGKTFLQIGTQYNKSDSWARMAASRYLKKFF